jgi:hypothetical protein
MTVYQPLSDQLHKWSAQHARQTLSNAATPTHLPPAPAPCAPGHPARLADRTLQALWQARLQVRQRSWPRSQVLFVNQPQRRAPADGLCSPKLRPTGARVSGQLSAHARDLGGDLHHQPRAATPPRAALRCRGEHSDPFAHRPRRRPPRRHAHRQHAGELPRRARSPRQTGGGGQ